MANPPEPFGLVTVDTPVSIFLSEWCELAFWGHGGQADVIGLLDYFYLFHVVLWSRSSILSLARRGEEEFEGRMASGALCRSMASLSPLCPFPLAMGMNAGTLPLTHTPHQPLQKFSKPGLKLSAIVSVLSKQARPFSGPVLPSASF